MAEKHPSEYTAEITVSLGTKCHSELQQIKSFEKELPSRCPVRVHTINSKSLTSATSVIYSRAFGDGPRHFEPWSSDETTPELVSSPLLTTTPTFELSTDFYVIPSPTWRVISSTSVVLVTRSTTLITRLPRPPLARDVLCSQLQAVSSRCQ
ncbi:hypothetical protein TNCV_2075931 [Trichonephila clavipes]|nr:hypothetical protein TNCV_2075931 [Trichonephila clavipes]